MGIFYSATGAWRRIKRNNIVAHFTHPIKGFVEDQKFSTGRETTEGISEIHTLFYRSFV